MQNVLLFVDKLSTWVGQAFSWLILSLTLLISWEVFSRYVLNHPHPWAFDVMIMMYGTLFMMAGAYTLAKNGHVRGDVLYGFFPPRLQAALDLLLYLLFSFPASLRSCAPATPMHRNPGSSTSTRMSPPTARRSIRSRPSFRSLAHSSWSREL